MRVSFRGRGAVSAAVLAVALAACQQQDPEAVQQAREQAEQFMRANAQRAGVVTTASGLQYEVIRQGSGVTPTVSDTVVVNYRGTFPAGDEFDSGEGIGFTVGGVIPGWTEGLQLMREGARYKFFVPPELGYGENGAGRVIPPNATLVFDVELVKVERDPDAPLPE